MCLEKKEKRKEEEEEEEEERGGEIGPEKKIFLTFFFWEKKNELGNPKWGFIRERRIWCLATRNQGKMSSRLSVILDWAPRDR